MRRPSLLALLLAALCTPAAARAQVQSNPHVRLGGRQCTDCHTTEGWRTVRFDHRATGFNLDGVHQTVPCTGCHDLRDFSGAAKNCASCHQDPHRGDAGTNCEQCHTTVSFQLVRAQDAHARTRLPDLGVHASLACTDCHRQTGNQQFTAAVNPCVACHQATYDRTSNPSHASLAFSTQCETCHQLATWNFALFAQHDAIFPIYNGAHAGRWQGCASCHTNQADFKTFVCTTCHTDARTTPRHAGIPGYTWESTACLSCHPDGRGGDLSFHDALFPIMAGTHAGLWTSCTTCHTDPTNKKTFSCMTAGCHAQTLTDTAHAGVPGYAYQAQQCYSCHPDGRGGNFTAHDATFPIYSGVHNGTWTSCAQCHIDPSSRTAISCTTAGCHAQATMDGLHQGIPNYGNTGAQCFGCHPTGAAGQFTQHDALFFPIYSGRHTGIACVVCHTNPTTRATFTCMGGACHPKADTDGNHSSVSGYQYVASACYTCHRNGTAGNAPPAFIRSRPRIRS